MIYIYTLCWPLISDNHTGTYKQIKQTCTGTCIDELKHPVIKDTQTTPGFEVT